MSQHSGPMPVGSTTSVASSCSPQVHRMRAIAKRFDRCRCPGANTRDGTQSRGRSAPTTRHRPRRRRPAPIATGRLRDRLHRVSPPALVRRNIAASDGATHPGEAFGNDDPTVRLRRCSNCRRGAHSPACIGRGRRRGLGARVFVRSAKHNDKWLTRPAGARPGIVEQISRPMPS
jgi:hypothetical protein